MSKRVVNVNMYLIHKHTYTHKQLNVVTLRCKEPVYVEMRDVSRTEVFAGMSGNDHTITALCIVIVRITGRK